MTGSVGLRNLVVVLGDQLDSESAAFDGFDPDRDRVLQMEVREEATYILQHKQRIAFFFSAMRHFREAQRRTGRTVIYTQIDDPENRGSFEAELRRWLIELRPERIVVLEPGDWRVRRIFDELDCPVEMRPDRHFLCSHEEFASFSDEQPRLVLETFYRSLRRKLGILVDDKGNPTGGSWNFDPQNRASFGRKGPPAIPAPPRFEPDALTHEVLRTVDRLFPDHPGRLDNFDLPVTRDQGKAALDHFVLHRLPLFGRYQDAMRTGEPFLFHSQLSGLLNLHLLGPREVLDAVLANPAAAPLNSVEGFVRQVLGWREFVRGVYWGYMPGYAGLNALEAELPVPRFYWTGETDMRCVAEAAGHTIDHAYAHHIERLMVLGQFCLLLGAHPYDVHRWHMSMFWDAIDWVSLPNALGMSQYGDGGIIGTKPYAASGNYINRMSDYCRHCRYDPTVSVGENACPFTTLYWDFLARHKARFADNSRMKYPYQNLARKDAGELDLIQRRAEALKSKVAAGARI